MKSQEKDKFIVEQLGGCWHELNRYEKFKGYCVICEKCGKKFPIDTFHDSLHGNPAFSSEAGRVQLLKLMDDNHDWNLRIRGYMPFIIINWIKNDNGEFRDEAFRFFKERKP